MEFDPTLNYDETDLTMEDNLICWKFGELIKNLITLSCDAQRQAEIIGAGAICDEMAEDFNTYFTLSYRSYFDSNLLTPNQLDKLKNLDAFFEERSGDQVPDFWNNSMLATNPDWATIREKASDILNSLGMQDLKLHLDREDQYQTTENGKRIKTQSTKTRLVRQNAS